MRKMTKSAFTLVELIVVITILAILATVAFISLGGQTDNARNTVKKDSIGKLATAVENARTTGVSIASFAVDPTTADLLVGDIAGIALTAARTAGSYGAGDINLAALDVKSEDFKDKNNSYLYGYSKFRGGKYEIAGSLKEGEFDTAYLVGNYEARTATAITGVITSGENKFTITSDSDIKKLVIGDTVDAGGLTDVRVTAVDDTYKVLTLESNATADGVTIELASDETAGLIESTTAGTPVTNASQNVPYAN